jgi:ABC-type transport system involved in multi-copper enzyme maturation permease subunit
MIWTIARREFLEYMKSMKFLIGFLITLALVVISTVINVADFRQRQQDYIAAQEEMKGDAFYIRVYRPPEALSILVQGKDRQIGNRLEFTYLSIDPRPTGYMGHGQSQHHRYVAGFSAIDYAFVVRIILSLMVIFLIYDAVSGEKSRGTLRLIHSNPIPRHTLLLGKFIGGLTVVLLALLIATIVSLLILIFSRSAMLGGSEWIRIAGMVAISALYLTCFFTIGLFVSVAVERPSIALTVLLQLWVFLNIIYPNLAVIVAETVYKLPGEEKINQEKLAVMQGYMGELTKTREEFSKAVMSGQNVPLELRTKNIQLTSLKADKEFQVDREFGEKLSGQEATAQMIAAISPAALYDQAMCRFARTGTENLGRFMDGVYMHWQKHVEITLHNTEHPEDWGKTKLPAFAFSTESSAESLSGTLGPVVILIIISMIFFMLAYTRFLKKDVR